MNTLRFRLVAAAEFPRLTEVWEAAVRSTHHFLTEQDIDELRPLVLTKYLPNVQFLAAAVDEYDRPVGFLGLSAPQNDRPAMIEMLFIEPASQGQGLGSAFLRLAIEKYGLPLDVEANEQNTAGVNFYLRKGFKQISRSEVDHEGRPFPQLYMRLPG